MKVNYLKILLIVLIFLSEGTEAAAGSRFAFIKSKELEQIGSVITGFTESFPEAETSSLNLDGKKDIDTIRQFIKSKNPSLIICMGALSATAVIQAENKIPIIFAMVINYKQYPELKQSNVTGISMEIPQESLFTQFRLLMPQVKSIGIPFHPVVSSEIVNDALAASKKMGIQIIPISVTDPDKISDALSENKEKYSGLWMLADTKLYNQNTNALRDLFLFSTTKKKPVLAFSEAFLKAGAFFSISIDYRSMGSQIALISKRIGEDNVRPSEIPIALPIGTFTVINKNVAKSLLGDSLNESIYDNVDKVFGE